MVSIYVRDVTVKRAVLVIRKRWLVAWFRGNV